jgi:hypothetical protein
MVKWHNLAAILFLAFENQTFLSSFQMVKTSVDRFGMNKIFVLLIKRSRLANRTRMSGFQMVRYSNAQDWHKIQSEYQPQFGIRWVTVFR